jgi:hypothetical protein
MAWAIWSTKMSWRTKHMSDYEEELLDFNDFDDDETDDATEL